MGYKTISPWSSYNFFTQYQGWHASVVRLDTTMDSRATTFVRHNVIAEQASSYKQLSDIESSKRKTAQLSTWLRTSWVQNQSQSGSRNFTSPRMAAAGSQDSNTDVCRACDATLPPPPRKKRGCRVYNWVGCELTPSAVVTFFIYLLIQLWY